MIIQLLPFGQAPGQTALGQNFRVVGVEGFNGKGEASGHGLGRLTGGQPAQPVPLATAQFSPDRLADQPVGVIGLGWGQGTLHYRRAAQNAQSHQRHLNQVQASLPTARHFGRVLRTLPHDAGQFLFDGTVQLLERALPPEAGFAEAISLDTKHILAWVKENNPKAYVLESVRLDKTRQPTGDPDCKLGCKKKRNASAEEVETSAAQPATPTKNPQRVTNFSSSDVYYWGYGSGVVATKVPDWGEFALAELTQTLRLRSGQAFRPG